MSRSRRFVTSVAIGYALIGANLLYTLLSIPLALHYLGKEGFGVWAVALQITGYLMLLDFGLTIAISRFLADVKDDISQPAFAQTFTVGCVIFLTQGVAITFLGSTLAIIAPHLFNIPESFTTEFQNVLLILAITSGLGMMFRAFGAPLWSFQRLDVIYGFNIFYLLSNLLFLWIGFRMGWGIYSLALASIPALFTTPIITFFFCRYKQYYPVRVTLRDFKWPLFRRAFLSGKDILFISLGSQLVNASQLLILSRWVNLEAAATFSIGTKFFAMGQQFSGRFFESASPGLAELFVRNESGKFQGRFYEIMLLTGFLSTVLGLALLLGNTLFISVWTSGKISWNISYDLLLALLLILTSSTRCTMATFSIVGEWHPVRYIYFLEACVFLALAIPAAMNFGILGVLIASLLAHITITALLAVRAARPYLNGDGGFKQTLLRSTAIILLAFIAIYLLPNINIPTLFNFLLLSILGACFLILSWWIILTSNIRSYLRSLLGKFIPLL